MIITIKSCRFLRRKVLMFVQALIWCLKKPNANPQSKKTSKKCSNASLVIVILTGYLNLTLTIWLMQISRMGLANSHQAKKWSKWSRTAFSNRTGRKVTAVRRLGLRQVSGTINHRSRNVKRVPLNKLTNLLLKSPSGVNSFDDNIII